MRIRQENLTGNNPHVDDPEWDFMDKMEFLDPWNLEEDLWAISKIKTHRFNSTSPGTQLEFLISYQCDDEEQWIPYQSVLDDEPWLVAQYLVTNKLKYRHESCNQLDWALKYIKSVGNIDSTQHHKEDN